MQYYISYYFFLCGRTNMNQFTFSIVQTTFSGSSRISLLVRQICCSYPLSMHHTTGWVSTELQHKYGQMADGSFSMQLHATARSMKIQKILLLSYCFVVHAAESQKSPWGSSRSMRMLQLIPKIECHVPSPSSLDVLFLAIQSAFQLTKPIWKDQGNFCDRIHSAAHNLPTWHDGSGLVWRCVTPRPWISWEHIVATCTSMLCCQWMMRAAFGLQRVIGFLRVFLQQSSMYLWIKTWNIVFQKASHVPWRFRRCDFNFSGFKLCLSAFSPLWPLLFLLWRTCPSLSVFVFWAATLLTWRRGQKDAP